MRARGFTLVELLVVVALVGGMVGVLLPALAGARGAARSAVCLGQLRQMGVAWTLYAGDHRGLAMPLAYTDAAHTRGGDGIYWWGADGSTTGRLDHDRGLLTTYLDARPGEAGLYACPAQRPGTYHHQGTTGTPTSTYGYNGYYLSPAFTPGWSRQIAHRPHQRLATIEHPTQVLVFADTLISRGPGALPASNALLDPPMLYSGGPGRPGRWQANEFPTSCFRHGGASAGAGVGGVCQGVHADGSAQGYAAQPEWLAQPAQGIGSIGIHNDPRYIPDWRAW
ncbi:MAG: prepilin-type N-terminal cleavage/methylation domain-containing protein [Phycisphaeraceae bacterium]|nr:prepilin-type N-terminal cleavage/methylation domain-containing protein [Phycisphaeraceae bacterium]